uniref:BHLH domain-containing protein n=1 Tax=Rhizophora mucronata TaxID=61149 RepID=A0A2P2K7Q9_RHIMU
MPISSPARSCVTSLSHSNILNFSYNNNANGRKHHQDQLPECNATATGGASKKARVQPPSSQPSLKLRKEKLGDRITALHQLVSPFGKTDTASVLLEAIGYIRFLQGQIEALSSPYLGATASSNMRNQQSVQGERNCVFPEDPGQLLNDICLKRKGAPNQDTQDKPKDLRSKGLCLVPVSCTQRVGNGNGADYWAPAAAIGGGGF